MNNSWSVQRLVEPDKTLKYRLSLQEAFSRPASTNFEVTYLVCTKGMSPEFCKLSLDVLHRDISIAVQEAVQNFIDTFLRQAPSEEVAE